MKYKLVEIFESLQGEGRNTGRRCIFLRFAGCNLACPWCDTDTEAHFEATIDEIMHELLNYSSSSIILTGGEPTIQPGIAALVEALLDFGYWVGVETNGTNACDWLAKVDYVACSPKAEFPDSLRLDFANEVRVVASSENIVEFCRDLPNRIAAIDYYISPCERDGEIDFATAKNVLDRLDDWSLSVQLHKILGFR